MVEHKIGDAGLDNRSAQTDAASKATHEASEGKADLVAQQKVHMQGLKDGKRSGITDEFGKPTIIFDQPKLDAKPQLVALETMGPYHEWDLKLGPNSFAESPDGGLVHKDSHGRIDNIRDVKGNNTTIQYQGDSDQPMLIKIAGGATLTWHGNGYGIAGQEGTIRADVDQTSGVIRWTNRHEERTRHFPSGGTVNENNWGKVTSVIDAYNQRTEFEYNGRSEFPSHIKAGFATGKPATEFDLIGDGKRPEYAFAGNADFGGGNRMAISTDTHTGTIYTMSLPDNNAVDAVAEMPTLTAHGLNGKANVIMDGDFNILPEPLRILINGTAKV